MFYRKRSASCCWMSPLRRSPRRERDRLFDLIRRLQAQGVGIIYISHRLAEVPMIGKRVTVMRDGKVIGTLPVEEAGENTLIRMMVGRQLTEQFPKGAAKIGRTILKVENLSLPNRLHDISFEVREGEILGIFGLMGAGQAELARAIFGLEPGRTGRILLFNQEIAIHHPTDAIRHGLGFLTRDRRQGLVPMLPIPPNITLANLSQSPLFRLMHLRSVGHQRQPLCERSAHPAAIAEPESHVLERREPTKSPPCSLAAQQLEGDDLRRAHPRN